MELQFDKIIKPFEGNSITGVNLRDHSTLQDMYYDLRDTRIQAKKLEEQFLINASDNDGLSEWFSVKAQAEAILINHSKDIEVLIFLTEALLRIDNIPGLTQGFKLIQNFIEQFWPQLYPENYNNEENNKLSAFNGLSGVNSPGSLIQPLSAMAITAAQTNATYYFWQYQQLRTNQGNTILDSLTDNDINKAIIESGNDFYQKLQKQFEDLKKEYDLVIHCLLQFCTQDQLMTGNLDKLFIEFIEFCKMAVEMTLKHNKTSLQSQSQTQNKNVILPEIKSSEINSVNTREEALASLHSIRNYFLDNEPHSPVPYLLQRVIKWTNLSLPELLNEFFLEEETKIHLGKLIGIDNQIVEES